MAKTIVDDGFAAYLVEGASFDGDLEIPILLNSKAGIIPDILLPFDKRKRITDDRKSKAFIHFYMHDFTFRQVITNTKKYLEELKSFGGVISPDCSLYVDMPLVLQQANTYLNRAVGHYLRFNGVNVIPNVRWGDERSYEFCFLGLEKHGLYSVSTHGCIRSQKGKLLFKKGLKKMIQVLEPKIIIVHGSMPSQIFEDYLHKTTFLKFDSYISQVFGKKV